MTTNYLFAALISPPTTQLSHSALARFHPPNPQCTDISIGRLPGKPQTNDWITEACACMCPSGVQPCEALDPAAAEAALQEVRDASNAAFQEAADISRAAFAAAVNATAPEGVDVTFYGSSFISDHTGQLLAKASRDQSQVLTARFDLDAIAQLRRSWGLFRDRRVDLYQPINRLGLAAL